ncbi:uncharacterized protein PHACADRAFT_212476 [Phanerochaete carnosa HHB-10118-sp]|uniref:Uncharacterized protein n=1 Tax=Phanerochaete carnosa (strain HHB-10118-sp) TaxID=650164 RepID=K5VZ38_PHACS|nr:uncharacterized protein PHACADRAFT_212476 [Phanerochaete carnosa HHB-10118-sp]EKM51859.1 hypothetical protein PHACADRAFT_212476 [Phanerochaete carnosa HHB-10118-sp]
MAAYYKPPSARVSISTSQRPPGESSSSHPYRPSSEVEEQSIYIFPVPSSVPSSPGGSSVFSAPSDLGDNLTISSVGRSRHSSISSQFTDSSRGHDGSTTRLSYVDEDEEAVFSPIVDVGLDSEVEVWEWTETEGGDDLPGTDGSWYFAASGSADTLPVREGGLLRRSSTSRTVLRHDSRAMHPRPTYMRSRTQSNTSAHSSHASRYTPQPRIRVPLLSFVTSFFSLDLDDPALRLLTHSTPESILFPGQASLLHDASGPGSSAPLRGACPSEEDKAVSGPPSEEDELHGLLRLLTDGSNSKSVRDGLAAVCESPLALAASPFALPGWSSLTSLCLFVGDVWTNGGRAWREFGASEVEPDAR